MKIKYTRYQKILELISAVLLSAIWIYVAMSFGSLPDKIPGHYNIMGEVDRWGNRGEILVMPVIGTVLYVMLTIAPRLRSAVNIPAAVTEEDRQYALITVRSMLITLKAEILAVFFYILYSDISTRKLGAWFLPVTLAIIFGTTIYFIVKACRKNVPKA